MNEMRAPDGLTFVKMHGAGNDFVILARAGDSARITPALARALGDRNRGVGFDQLAAIGPSTRADVSLSFWNADGTPSGACGNAARCIAAREMAQRCADRLSLETSHGILVAERHVDGNVWVNMGQPRLDWRGVPLARAMAASELPLPGTPMAIGMGNPHCITFVDDVAAVDLTTEGPALEHHPMFPERTNVEFAEVRADGTLRLRVWERGTGITLACGSGACATAVAAHTRGLTGKAVEIEMDGGWLSVDWRDDGVWLTGPVAHVFDGLLSADWVEAVR